MKPTTTCHAIRKILQCIRSVTRVSPEGLYVDPPAMPDVNLPTDTFRRDWLAYNLARKREIDRPETEAAARAAFSVSEHRCATISMASITSGLDRIGARVLLAAQNIAFELLGSTPPADWYRECTFTGGASTSRKRDEAHPAFKWWASPSLDVTPLALKHLLAFKASCEAIDCAWSDPGILACERYDVPPTQFYRVVPGSRLDFVEKNYKTKRAILIEPDGNMLLQKGVGNIIRKRLKRAGIDLNDQGINQWLAMVGSLTGSLGTIDLAAASDSVTLAICQLLLPSAWFELLYELRSPVYRDGDEWKTMRKMSSMGNGFTFELESLIFYCLSEAVVRVIRPTETRVGVYGDDIIVASSACGYLEAILERCGFSLNREKSFWRGPFRESCGKHYHHGTDVTPFYVKKCIDSLDQKYRLVNQFSEWVRRAEEETALACAHGLETLVNLIPVKERCQVPETYASTTGLYDPQYCTSKIRFRHNRDGHEVLDFSVWAPSKEDLTKFVAPEAIWLYRHMDSWVASDVFGFDEYTPFTLVREGEPERQRVSIPAARVPQLIP